MLIPMLNFRMPCIQIDAKVVVEWSRRGGRSRGRGGIAPDKDDPHIWPHNFCFAFDYGTFPMTLDDLGVPKCT